MRFVVQLRATFHRFLVKFLEFDPLRKFHEASSTILYYVHGQWVHIAFSHNKISNGPARGILCLMQMVFAKMCLEKRQHRIHFLRTAYNIISKQRLSSQNYEGSLLFYRTFASILYTRNLERPCWLVLYRSCVRLGLRRETGLHVKWKSFFFFLGQVKWEILFFLVDSHTRKLGAQDESQAYGL